MKLPFPLYHLAVFLGMVVYSIPVYIVAPFDPQRRLVDVFARRWMQLILNVTGVQIPPELADKLPGPGPYVFMANHQSHLDVALIYAELPEIPKFVAKRELLFVPVFGTSMWALGHIAVDRRNRERAIKSLAAASEKIRSGTNVLVFPEGTRTSGDPDVMGEFKKGGFMLAIQSGVPILPMGIAGTADRMPKDKFMVYPGQVCFRFGTPIQTAGLGEKDRDALMQQTREAIAKLKRQAYEDLRDYTRTTD